MQTHNFSDIKSVNGHLSIQDRLEGIYKYGFSWPKDLNAQDVFTALLQREVDQRSVLIRDFKLPQLEVTIPFLLIGPPGVRMILLTRERGMFRARGEEWLVHTGKGFRPTKVNLIVRTKMLTRATQDFFDDRGFQNVVVDGLIVGINPGMHVETHHSAVRVIQSDAIRRFGSQWNLEKPEISPEQIYQIVASIKRAGTPDPEAENKDKQSLNDELKIDKFAKSVEPLHKIFNFNAKQWVIIGGLIVVTVLVLLVFMFFIIFSL